MKRPVWIDCDPGIDDAIALMVALCDKSGLDVKGVTTVAGNQSLEKTYRNALRILAHLGRSDIPVGKGAAKPLKRNYEDSEYVHGEDGLGGMRIPSVEVPKSPLLAQNLLVKALSEAPAMPVIATGPLTNLAVLFTERPELKQKISHIVIMGGCVKQGNVTPYAEYNFYADPHAAQIVFDSGIPITMLGLDVTHKAYLTDDDVHYLARHGTVHAQMLEDLLPQYAKYYKTTGLPGVPVHDASAVFYEIDPTLFSDVRKARVTMVTEGEQQGRSVVEYGTGEDNAQVVFGVDRKRYLERLDEYSACK